MATSQSISLTPTSAPTGQATTPHKARTTCQDAIDHLIDYMGSNVNQEALRVAKRAIQLALKEVTNARRWSYYYQHGRIQTNAPYSTGTVALDVTGGTYERQLTLTTGTWPTWAAYGSVRIGTVTYDVDRRISDSIVTLDSTITSAADISSTSYTLFQDTFDLPSDFVAMDESFTEESWGGMEYVHPTEWLRVVRYYQSTSNTPRFYTIRGNPDVPGRMSLSLFPYPDSARTVDFIYQRRPRDVTLDSYTTGTVSVSASSTTITGSGTTFTAPMVGSVIRLSADSTNLPSGFAGSNPYSVERNIRVFTSATSLTVDDTIDSAYSGVKFRISDPLDLEDGAMIECFFRCAERHVSILRQMKNQTLATQLYQDALIRAEEADARSFMGRAAGYHPSYAQRLKDMPLGPDVS